MLGGPVVLPKLYNGRNKTFFFFVYSGFRFRQGSPNSLQSLIPLDFRQGDFSRFGADLRSGHDAKHAHRYRRASRSPATAFRRIASARSREDPRRCCPTPDNNALFNNFISVGRGQTDSNQYNIKLDHSFSDRNRLSGYYYQDRSRSARARTDSRPGHPGPQQRQPQSLEPHHPRLRVLAEHAEPREPGLYALQDDHESYSVDQDWPTQARTHRREHRARTIHSRASSLLLPATPASATVNCNSRMLQTNNAFQFGDSFSVMRGRHSLKFGVDYRCMETNGIDIYQANGLCSSSTPSRPACPEVPIPATPLRVSCSAAVDRGTVRRYSPTIPRNRYKYWAGYAQDDWKATRKLTLNYGLRYDIFIPALREERQPLDFRSDHPQSRCGRTGSAHCISSAKGRAKRRNSLADTYWKAFGPRLGLAYQLNGQDSPAQRLRHLLRAGQRQCGPARFAAMRASASVRNPYFPAPDAGVTPAFNWNSGFPQNLRAACRSSIPPPRNGADAAPDPAQRRPPPYFQNWSFTIEREIVPQRQPRSRPISAPRARASATDWFDWNELDPRY